MFKTYRNKTKNEKPKKQNIIDLFFFVLFKILYNENNIDPNLLKLKTLIWDL